MIASVASTDEEHQLWICYFWRLNSVQTHSVSVQFHVDPLAALLVLMMHSPNRKYWYTLTSPHTPSVLSTCPSLTLLLSFRSFTASRNLSP